MSYSFGFVTEDAEYYSIRDGMTNQFAESYPEPAAEVKSAVEKIAGELPYLAEQFAGGTVLPEGHNLNITVSGHEHVDEDDQAPRYVSLTMTLNKKSAEDSAAEAAEDVAEKEPVTA